jgi:hypothetical protein
VLVVDVGGGTSDFSLIAILERDGKLEPHRVAVGDHILLGGDNMDLALAHLVARKLQANGTQLDAWQMRALTYACRGAKEHLLADATECHHLADRRAEPRLEADRRLDPHRTDARRSHDLHHRRLLPARGSGAPSGHPHPRRPDAARPAVCAGRRPSRATWPPSWRARPAPPRTGRLRRQRESGAQLPASDAVLFNGGVFKSEILAQRVMDTINDWLYMEGAEPARMLEGADLDLAVARGAAYYGYARRGGGVRIRGGTARSYYVGVESSMPAIPGMEPPIQALCVAPFGMEEGSELELPGQEFGLVVGEPVHFRFFGSTTRRQDQIGDVLDFWGPDELQELNEIQATLPAEGRTPGDVVQVKLHALATEAGTLELAAVARDGQRWKVEFDVRTEQ